ncbi:MAG: iron ABC transporter permease [Proteobacteria bacterium]|nr:iron ABC transporter permease [Pseudomonadota bacterium]
MAAPAAGFLSLMAGGALSNVLAFSPIQLNAMREMSLLLAGIAVLAGSMGLISAWLVSIYDFPLRRLIEVALVLPLAFPTYLAAFVAVDLLDFFGPVQSLWRWLIGAKTLADYRFFEVRSLPGAIIVLSLVLFPYVYVPCRLVFSQGGRNVIDAARLLGARGAALFLKVGAPLAMPAILAGLVLAMLEAINDIGATEHLGVSSFSVVIRDLWLNRFDLPSAARLAGLLLGIVALLVVVEARLGRRKSASPRNVAHPRPIRLGGWQAVLACFLTGMPVLLGFVIPAGFLVWRAFLYAGQQAAWQEFALASLSSLTLATGVTAAVLVLSAALAIAMRIAPRLAVSNRIAAFGYAIPGTVLVLALFPVFRTLDDALSLVGSGAAISGTLGAIILALCVRFLGLGASQAGFALRRLPRSIDWVARIHGMNDLRLALRVHLPAMMPGLMLGGTLIFIDAVKELPATLLLRPLNFETLATRAYAQASAGAFEHAALDSLAILALSGIAALMLIRKR